ncbi:MJ1255/VC2487 family glycosyltransferase [Photobacterium swingsii]|uniref:MJ1255/VC2487 family glycosyltransferase n=1 Tax=Photobacterium swingsii TaxID=680026 RepID=UPI00406862FB
MKILYGVQGTGNGHISRAREMARAFKVLGQPVDFFFSGREPDKYFDMGCFGDYRTAHGLTFVTQQGKIAPLQTALQARPFTFINEVKQLNLSAYDVVINDFEPVTAWAARQQKVPTIGVSHQCAFTHPVPKKDQTWFDKQLIRHFAPAEQKIGLHWHHFDAPILPPIIPALDVSKVSNDGSVVVYLPFEALNEVVVLLQHFPQVVFHCYHPDIQAEQQQENLYLHPLSHTDFHQHLLRCMGVIASGGFELPSEAMALGKKLLIKPLGGQFEQQSNTLTLTMMGLAQPMTLMEPSIIRHWLGVEPIGKVYFPDVALAVAQWVLNMESYQFDELCEQLWSQVEFPEYVTDILLDFQASPSRLSKANLINGVY